VRDGLLGTEKERKKERRKRKKKERKKGRKERRKGKKRKKKGRRRMVGHDLAGGSRWWPEMGGRSPKPKPREQV